MSGTGKDVAKAQAETAAARAQLAGTLGEIQGRLQPQVLMREGLDRLRVRGNALAEETMAAARAKPALAGAIAGGILLFLLRRPVFRLLRRLFFKRDETDRPADRLNDANGN